MYYFLREKYRNIFVDFEWRPFRNSWSLSEEDVFWRGTVMFVWSAMYCLFVVYMFSFDSLLSVFVPAGRISVRKTRHVDSAHNDMLWNFIYRFWKGQSSSWEVSCAETVGFLNQVRANYKTFKLETLSWENGLSSRQMEELQTNSEYHKTLEMIVENKMKRQRRTEEDEADAVHKRKKVLLTFHGRRYCKKSKCCESF